MVGMPRSSTKTTRRWPGWRSYTPPNPHAERPERDTPLDDDELREAEVPPHPNLSDRMHNPKDLDVDERAMEAGVEHGGNLETPARARAVRGHRERESAPSSARSRRRNQVIKRGSK
jgi:hypothetical protein